MEFVLLSALTLVNLLLWLVFLIRFKRLFSADDIMARFREGMESILQDAQRGTAMSMNVLDEKIKEAKALAAEAERKLEIVRREMQSAEKAAYFQAQLNLKASPPQASEDAPASAPKKTRARTSAKASAAKPARPAKGASARVRSAYKQNELPAEDEAYALTGLFRENEQDSLFGQPQITVTGDGDSYGRVPIIKMQALASDSPIKPKKSFKERVRELSELGKSVEEIASLTDHSTTEVQLVLDTAI